LRFQGPQAGYKGGDGTKGIMRVFRGTKRKEAEARQAEYDKKMAMQSSAPVTEEVGSTGNVIVEEHPLPAAPVTLTVEVPLTAATVNAEAHPVTPEVTV
jgi:hypothetical protein